MEALQRELEAERAQRLQAEEQHRKYMDAWNYVNSGQVEDLDLYRRNVEFLYPDRPDVVESVMAKVTGAGDEPVEEDFEEPEEEYEPEKPARLPPEELDRIERLARREWKDALETRLRKADKVLKPVAEARAKRNGGSVDEELGKLRNHVAQEAYQGWKDRYGNRPDGSVDMRTFEPTIERYVSTFEKSLGFVVDDRGFLGQAPDTTPEKETVVPPPFRGDYRTEDEYRAAIQRFRESSDRQLGRLFT